MREIKFRGKCTSPFNKHESIWFKWLYGSLLIEGKDYFINDPRRWETLLVDPKTIGQYTGLLDKNGVKIFEGDIVHVESQRDWAEGRVYFHEKESTFVFTVPVDSPLEQDYRRLYGWKAVEVIGNVFDNQELQEVECNDKNK